MSATEPPMKPVMVQCNVLLVDDEPAILAALEMAFESEPWRIERASSGEQALELCAVTPFDAYLIDKNMPGMSGIDLVREIRRRDEAAAIVMMTGFGSVTSALEALNLGVDSYLEKPFRDLFGIAPIVTRALRAADLRRGHQAPLVPSPHGHELPGLTLLLGSPSEERRAAIAGALLGPTSLSQAATIEELRRLAEQGPDVIVIDGSGWEVTAVVAAARQVAAAARVVVVGGRMEVTTVRRLIELGVNWFVREQVGSPELSDSVRQLLEVYRVRKHFESRVAK